MIKLAIVLGLFCSIFFSGCFNEAENIQSRTLDEIIVGKWKTPCVTRSRSPGIDGKPTSTLDNLEYKADQTASFISTVYFDDECQNPNYQVAFTARYELIKKPDLPYSAIKYQIDQAYLTSLSDLTTSAFDFQKLCNISSWQTNLTELVTGKYCFKPMPKTDDKSFQWVTFVVRDGRVELFFGELPTTSLDALMANKKFAEDTPFVSDSQ